MLRIPRALAVVVAAMALSLLVVGCSSGSAVPTTPATAPPVTNNDFIPTGQNLSDCVGTLELPNCGSEKKSDLRLYLTFAALMGGMGLIGWRIAVGIRARDREDRVPEHTF
ncbi:MAG: hypothetical protein JWM12_996 [Ilumatobacteraceae bacterium]|nr:hypothetical protein [Ilumatobacteraceae bacterium]